MVQFKSKLTKSEEQNISLLLQELTDVYSDFYITKNNLRLYIKENLYLLFDCLNKGDKIAYEDNGVAIVTGYSDNNDRKYVKILTKDVSVADRLIKVISWNLTCSLYIKIKKNNPLKDMLVDNGFMFVAGRGKEILLSRKGRQERQNDRTYKNKDKSARRRFSKK